jgi:Flp pilus assembly pilin Flp
MERRVEATAGAILMTTRQRRDAKGASVVEYALLMALVLLVVVASVYALGRTPEHPASVIGETFNSPAGGGPGPSVPTSSSSTSTSTTTTSSTLPPLPP